MAGRDHRPEIGRTSGGGSRIPLRYTLGPLRSGLRPTIYRVPGGSMPEILTESFCERCGTRYTFESVAPRKTRRLGQFKTLSRGMKNWVMSDDSSLDEAMAAARSDEEREVTAQQLDAFHATFNFCMTCRQYTCSNCWNAVEGRCLTCAPGLVGDVLPAPFPDASQFEPVRIDAEAWPEADLPGIGVLAEGELGVAASASNGAVHDHEHDHGNGLAPDGIAAGDSNGAVHDDLPQFDAAARLAFLAGDDDAPTDGTTAADEANLPPDAAAAGLDAGEPEATEQGVTDEADQAEDIPEALLPVSEEDAPSATEDIAAAAQPADDTAAQPADDTPLPAAATASPDVEPLDVEPLPEDIDLRAAAGAARTSELLARFRPGQNIDAELAAYEAQLDLTAEGPADTAAIEESTADQAPSIEAIEAEAQAPTIDVAPTDGEPEFARTGRGPGRARGGNAGRRSKRTRSSSPPKPPSRRPTSRQRPRSPQPPHPPSRPPNRSRFSPATTGSSSRHGGSSPRMQRQAARRSSRLRPSRAPHPSRRRASRSGRHARNSPSRPAWRSS